MVKVKFFAALRERLNCAEIDVESQRNDTVAQIRERLVAQHPTWQHELLANEVLCAKNFTFTDVTATVQSGDELAFFPPVTGG
tara:strand:+ start:128 stop:376 length:249 start_codon:yes stop_codon:yes gene_type:complete